MKRKKDKKLNRYLDLQNNWKKSDKDDDDMNWNLRTVSKKPEKEKRDQRKNQVHSDYITAKKEKKKINWTY